MANDRETIVKCSQALARSASDAHAQCMALMRRASWLEVLAGMATDDQCASIVQVLIAEGILVPASSEIKSKTN